MTRNKREWKQFSETYDIMEQLRLPQNKRPRTLAARINRRLLKLKYQFLPHYFGNVPKWRMRLRSFGGPRILPDFACIGPIKSGTSDLSTYLFQHPSILVPLSKEIQAPNIEVWRCYYPTVREKAQVEKEFGKAISGYFAPALNSLLHLEAVYAATRDAKIILMLRNPVDRAYSQYKWELFLGGMQLARFPYYQTFADYVNFALDLFPAMPLPSRTSNEVIQTGIYVKPVELWIERFGRENVHILRAEDFFKDIPSAVCAIHEFLGLPPMKPEIHPVVNQNPIKAPPLDEAGRQALQAFYRPWNEKLYALLDRDMEWDK